MSGTRQSSAEDRFPSLKEHPAFRGEASVIPLSGFSGAHVALVEHPLTGVKVVRKAASTPDDSQRLQEQSRRQTSLIESLDVVVRIPRVLDEGVVDNCYWFDMDFIPGGDAIDYLSIGSRERVNRFLAKIADVWDAQANVSDRSQVAIDLHSVVSAKLDEIDAKTREAFRASTDSIRSEFGATSANICQTTAHGDFTLENILIDREENMWLIDPIPSPVDHHWFDLAKLFQDVEGGWFLLRNRSLSLGVRCAIFDVLQRTLEERHPEYLPFHRILLALNFARILPYCRAQSEIAFVVNRINLALQSQMAHRAREK